MNEEIIEKLQLLYQQHYSHLPDDIKFLISAGSDRKYYRISYQGKHIVGTFNPNPAENTAFFEFTRHFRSKGLSVPEIIAFDEEQQVYLQEDLGDVSLFSLINTPEKVDKNLSLIRKVLQDLAVFQVKGHEHFNYDWTYSGRSFDHYGIVSDLNYWKYYFLRPLNMNYDGHALDKDFDTLATWLEKAPLQYFMYRDFQSRNIMVKGEELYFIDYQGGRYGPALYDCASFLWQAKSGIPFHRKEELAKEYIQNLLKISGEYVKQEELFTYYKGFVLLRLLQVLGAYGYRGLFERKPHFLSSIPLALDNLSWWLAHYDVPLSLPVLRDLLQAHTRENVRQRFATKQAKNNSSLSILVNSFSYKQGLPVDESGNGGGFVFDCRFIDNPGRKEEYKTLTGKDDPVKQYLTSTAMPEFLEGVFNIIDKAVENYIERDFGHLMVSFGCTGGQHRSVYAAEQLSVHLKEKYGVPVKTHHIEQEKKNKDF